MTEKWVHRKKKHISKCGNVWIIKVTIFKILSERLEAKGKR